MSEFSVTGLRVLREIASRGSFTAAADALGYTQSAVSRQAAALELAASSTLFERGTRGVRLTASGAVLLSHAIAVIDQLDAALREVGEIRPLATSLRVGAFPTALAALVPRAVAVLRAQHPGIGVTLREGTTPTQLRRLDSGAAHVAVIATLLGQPPDPQQYRVEPLLEDRLLLALPREHPLAHRGSVEVKELAGEHWIAATSDPDDVLLGVWPSLGWRPHVAYVARDWMAKLGLVAGGLGITVVPGVAAAAAPANVSLVRVLGGDPGARTVALATRGDLDRSPEAAAFAEALHQVAGELSFEIARRLQTG